MNVNIAILGLIEIFSAITIGIFILALTFKIVQRVGRKYYGIKEYNLSYSIYTAAIIISVGIMISGIIDPLISSFRLLNRQSDSFMLAFKYIGTGAIYIGIAYTATILIGLISTFMYSKITPINEFEEIRKNNKFPGYRRLHAVDDIKEFLQRPELSQYLQPAEEIYLRFCERTGTEPRKDPPRPPMARRPQAPEGTSA